MAAHAEVSVGSRQSHMDVEHEGHHQCNEQVEHVTELGNVGLEWIDVWDDDEQQEQSQCHQRQQEHAHKFGCVAVHLVIGIPMRRHLVGQLIPEQVPQLLRGDKVKRR
jgi:hypothetical protein